MPRPTWDDLFEASKYLAALSNLEKWFVVTEWDGRDMKLYELCFRVVGSDEIAHTVHVVAESHSQASEHGEEIERDAFNNGGWLRLISVTELGNAPVNISEEKGRK